MRLNLPAAVFVATAPINLRLSFDRLAGIIREQLGQEPRGEVLCVFHNKRRTHLKLMWHDGGGYWIAYKRLDRRTFRIPLAIPPGAAQVKVSERELSILLDGVDMATLRAARRSIQTTISRKIAGDFKQPCRGAADHNHGEQFCLQSVR